MTDSIPTLNEMSARGREIAGAYYESGYVAGVVAGCQQMFDAWRATAERSAAVAAVIANAPSFAELCNLRGEPERAERQRATLVDRGVAA